MWWRLRRAVMLTYQENCLSISKGAAYSGLLALFPVLTAVATVLVQMQARPVLDVLSRFLSGVLPPGTETLVLNRFTIQGQRPISLIVLAVFLAAYAASGFMMSLMEGFNSVYRVPAGRPFLKENGRAFLLVFVSALPFLGASTLILFGTRSEEAVIRWLQGTPEGRPLTGPFLIAGQIARLAVALGAVVMVTGLLYFLGPNRRQRWRNVWPGAWLATGLWLGATLAFAWYVRNIATYNVMYGSIGAVIALIVWIYLIAIIACFGCAYNAAGEQPR